MTPGSPRRRADAVSPPIVEYREILPPLELRSVVKCFWTLRGPAQVELEAAEPILPDGCVELVLNFADPFVRLTE